MVDFTENFSQYAKSKLPDFRDKFNGISKWQQSGTSIAVNSSADQVDWDFSRDAINKAVSHDLGVVSDKSWVLRWKFIVNNFANISTSATGGWIGLYSDDHSVDSATNQSFLHCFIRNANAGATQQIRMFQSDGSTNPENGVFDVEFTHTFPVATAEYYELKRESATSYRLSIYSDANYSDIIETQSFATSSAVSGLRYIKIAGFNQTVIAQVFDGNIDEVEFWNAEAKPTFEDDFATYNNQTEADNAWSSTDNTRFRVNITNDNLDFNINLENTNLAIAHDLGVGNVSDERWIFEAKINFTQFDTDTNSRMYFGLSSNDENTSIIGNADRILIRVTKSAFGGGDFSYKAIDTDGVGETAPDTTINFTFLTGVDYFLRIVRESLTTYHVEVFTDSARTVSLGKASGTCPSTLENLRYIFIQNINATLNGTIVGTMDDVEFHNGVTSIPTGGGFVEGATTLEEDFTLRPADFLDDFSYANQGLADTAWASTDVARLDPFPNELTWDMPVAGTTLEEAIFHDLGAPLSDTNWTCRFKVDLQGITSDNAVGIVMIVALSDITGIRTALQDAVGIQYSVDTGVNQQEIRIGWTDNQQFGVNQTTIRNSVIVETQFVEMTRTSATSVLINIYSDPDFTVLTDSITQVIPATTDGLRYLKVYLAKPSGTNAFNGVVDDIEVYDGESVLSRWTSRALSRGVVNTKDKRIDWVMSRDGTDNRVVYDLGVGTVSDTNWLLKFRYHVNAGGVISTVSGANYQVLFQDTDVGQASTNDTIGFSMSNTLAPFGRTLVLLGRNAGASSGFASAGDAFIPFGGAFDMYVELRRVSATSIIVNVYNDSDFTDLLITMSVTTSSANVGHRYLVCSSGDDNAGWNGTETGFIDNIEFYNEQSVSKIPVKAKVPDFEDKFWEDNWTDVGAQHGVNTSTNVIDWDSARLAEAINQTTIDMETILPNGINPLKWGLRFKYRIDAVTAGGASSQFAVFLTSLASNSSSESAQDHATWKVQGNVPPAFAGMIDDGTQIYTGSASSFVGTPVGEFGYGEMTRNGTLFSWAVYSDPDFTQLLGSGSVNDNSVLAGLRYLKIGRRDGTVVAFTFNGIISNIKFWNGSLPTEHDSKWVEVNVA